MNRAEAREQRAKRVERIRNDEALCALDFLTWGDIQGEHAKRCVFKAEEARSVHSEKEKAADGARVPSRKSECAREYDPGPMPDDEKMYEGTGIGILFGLNGDGPDPNAWQLAGWNVTRREELA